MRSKFARGASLAFILLVITLGIASAPPSQGQSSAQVQTQVAQAYASLLGAEQSGGNVTSLVGELNSAIALIQQADRINATNPTQAQSLYAQASNLAEQVISGAPAVASAGKVSIASAQLELVVETIVLGSLAVVVYMYTPRLFWRIWLRFHRDWRVKKA